MTATRKPTKRELATAAGELVVQTVTEAALLISCYLEGRPLTANDREEAGDVVRKLDAIREALKG